MSSSDNNKGRIRRLLLPGGRTIEVVWCIDHPELAETEPITQSSRFNRQDLHVCPKCKCDLVYPPPKTYHGVSETHWSVLLYCPNCDWKKRGVYDQQTVERFDEALDRGTKALADDLERLRVANMKDEIDLFVRASEADQIWPMDF
jgi:hypothetical protein